MSHDHRAPRDVIVHDDGTCENRPRAVAPEVAEHTGELVGDAFSEAFDRVMALDEDAYHRLVAKLVVSRGSARLSRRR